MVRRSLPAVIGALGSAKARFFHPCARIREQWTNDYKRELTRVLVIGEGQTTVNRKEQWCYIVRIPEIDDGTEFHIVRPKRTCRSLMVIVSSFIVAGMQIGR